MSQSRLSKALLGLSLGLTGFGAQAYLIDFTEGLWNSADGQSTYMQEITEGDITFYVQLDAYKDHSGVLSERYLSVFEEYDGGVSDNCKNTTSSDSTVFGPHSCTYDGIGVKNKSGNTTDDEINETKNYDVKDLLKVSFFSFSDVVNDYVAASVNIDSIVLLDLFADDDNANYSLSLNGAQGPTGEITPDSTVNGGFFTLENSWGLDDPADSIFFWGDDFALAGLNISTDFSGSTTSIPIPVSEPESMALFGLGLMGLGFATRRRKNRS